MIVIGGFSFWDERSKQCSSSFAKVQTRPFCQVVSHFLHHTASIFPIMRELWGLGVVLRTFTPINARYKWIYFQKHSSSASVSMSASLQSGVLQQWILSSLKRNLVKEEVREVVLYLLEWLLFNDQSINVLTTLSSSTLIEVFTCT